jgi:hypothetical protein
MIIRFSVTEVTGLFTTYDYERLIREVEGHFNTSAKFQGFDTTCTAYYNPERNEGIIFHNDTYDYVYLESLELAYGIDFITIKFK